MVCITYCVYVGPLIPMICWIVENLNFSVQIGVAMTRCTNQLHPFFVVDYDAPVLAETDIGWYLLGSHSMKLGPTWSNYLFSSPTSPMWVSPRCHDPVSFGCGIGSSKPTNCLWLEARLLDRGRMILHQPQWLSFAWLMTKQNGDRPHMFNL